MGVRFQVSFNPFLRELFTFPLRYSCTIGHLVYLALPEGAGSFTRTTTESVLLGIPSPCFPLCVRGYHPLWRRFPAVFHFGTAWASEGPTTPQDLRPHGLGSSPFARHYSGNTCWYLFLRVLRCFTSPGSPLLTEMSCKTGRVAPFGNPGINACLRLPQAYRSLPRPSSPRGAKASPAHPYYCNPHIPSLSKSLSKVFWPVPVQSCRPLFSGMPEFISDSQVRESRSAPERR